MCVRLAREKISINPVSSTLCSDVSPTVGPSGVSGPLGYIRVATFNGKTAEAFREALISLKVSSASSWEECVWGRVAEGGLLNRSARHGNVGRVLVEGDGAGIFDTIPRTLARPLPFQKQGAERFVLDIRNNGGGLFPAGALAPLYGGLGGTQDLPLPPILLLLLLLRRGPGGPVTDQLGRHRPHSGCQRRA